jgi:hypothetical protein
MYITIEVPEDVADQLESIWGNLPAGIGGIGYRSLSIWSDH